MPDLLQIIADNPALKEALRSVLLKQFDAPRALADLSATDETLGQATRARLTGILAIDSAFREIEKYASVSTKKEERNPAR